jgi:hypothetical protein
MSVLSRCERCGGPLILHDGEKACPDCVSYMPAGDGVLFFAYFQGEFLLSGETLEGVCEYLRDVNDPRFGEEVAIYRGRKIVAVFQASGTVVRLDRARATA